MQFTESSAFALRTNTNCPKWAVVIGAATGGPQALAKILPEFSADFPGVVIVVQKMRPGFTRVIADQFNHTCNLPVHEPQDGEALLSSRILIVPATSRLSIGSIGNSVLPGYSIFLEDSISDDSEQNMRIDSTMASVAEAFGENSIGVLLTGIGSDGKEGIRSISEAGGITIAQDESSSAVFDLPSSAIDAGLVQRVLPLWNIAENINDVVTGGQTDAAAA